MPQHKTNSVMYNTDDCYNLTMKIKKKKKTISMKEVSNINMHTRAESILHYVNQSLMELTNTL
jgi:hypothetical protein